MNDAIFLIWPFPFLLFSLFLATEFDKSNMLHRVLYFTFIFFAIISTFFSSLIYFYGMGMLGANKGFPFHTLAFLGFWFLGYKILKHFTLKARLALVNKFTNVIHLNLWLAWTAVYPSAILTYYLAKSIYR